MHQAYCKIVPLDRYNWEACLEIELLPEQEAFVPSVLYSLAQARFENLFPFGIEQEGQMVGMVMYGEFGGICWINRILIDKRYQRQGIGRTAMRQILEHLQGKMSCKEIRTSYAAENEAAVEFFRRLRFKPITDYLQGEVVARYEGLSYRMRV